MKVLVTIALMLLGFSLPSLPITIKEFEEKLQAIKTIKVTFIQKTSYSWYPKPEISKGYFFATKGGKFRIEYTYPDDVVIVSDGKEIIILNKEDKEALIDKVENNTSPVIESLFFFSRPISEVFEKIGSFSKGDLTVFILKPKRKDDNVDKVLVEVKQVKSRLHIKGIKVVDIEKTETYFEFIDIKTNFTPSASLFDLTIPEDVKARKAYN